MHKLKNATPTAAQLYCLYNHVIHVTCSALTVVLNDCHIIMPPSPVAASKICMRLPWWLPEPTSVVMRCAVAL